MKRTISAALIALISLILVAVPSSAQWHFIDGGLATVGSTLAYGIHDSNLFISGGYGVVDRYISPQNWATADKGIDFSSGGAVTSFDTMGSFFFAGISYNGGPGPVYVSTDNGSNWNAFYIASPLVTNGTYLFAQSFSMFGKNPQFIARSSDIGTTWDSMINFRISNYALKGNLIFATGPDSILRSTNSGTTWSRVTAPITIINSFAFIDTLTFGANGRIIKSTDSGSSWTDVSIPDRNTSVLVSDSTWLFAGTDSGVYISFDFGGHWRAVSEGLFATGSAKPRVTAMIVFDTLLVAGIDAGNGRGYDAARPIREMVDTNSSAVREPSVASDSIEIYPNPALGIVTIHSANVSLFGVSVVNLLGTDVLELNAHGETNISLDLSKLQPGTYFVKIEAARGTVLRKVIRE